ncbi:RNA-binding ribosome biosynthesis protein mak21 [Malassezia nana]|uniref:RNA-binding ribosome biosynthesis protein mak21 n=1 Tax=Malassezia nana TaxID=180528 RepID=A0AAF0EGI4_9BASI|nr:RNA-binding ribosome biosynthesis protein mak21 [Malassezia nana]
MPRDARPKGQGGAAPKAARRPKQGMSAHANDDEDFSEDVLRREVHALGGTEDDIALIQGKGSESRHTLTEDELYKELQEFMAQERMPVPAVLPRRKDSTAQHSGSVAQTKGKERKVQEEKSQDKKGQEKKGQEKKGQELKGREARQKNATAQPQDSAGQQKDAARSTKPQSQAPMQALAASASRHVVFDGDEPRMVTRSHLQLLLAPTSEWTQRELPKLDVQPLANVPETLIASLQELGKQVLDSENDTYARLASGEGGKNVILGSLNFSDLQFARTLLSSNKASTLSDRISAVTLLLQSSPLHNLKALETLMTMAGKPGREEASRATRALADWLASGGGLGENKLCYFRDQPLLAQVAAAYQAGVTDAVRQYTCAWAFEDVLKRTYFTFVQILERQSHDTLLFMRRQAVSQVFVLLRDKSEQEHNLLRLLTNKLGDPDRSVASKASTHLMELLQVHPAMKAIVLREVTETVLQSQVATSRSRTAEAPGKGNQHATYYGVLTMNQTLFTAQDAMLANDIFSVYFQLFEVCLQQEEAPEKPDEASKSKDKKRWRDRNAPVSPAAQNKAASDVYGRLLAAILTGIRRVFPFTTLDTDALDRHLETLFRITHTHSFNIAIQALQLIFQVAIAIPAHGETTRSFSSKISDRYYRTLYESMLDARLTTTSKQAMYLNLVYKSIKADDDLERVKAMIKRLCQILQLQEPPFIVGTLVLLSEVFRARPSLRSMMTDPEEEGLEHFRDVDEEAPSTNAAAPSTSHSASYDGRKRDPRFAHAGDSALWDLLPLLRHFHPSVRLNAQQLLEGVKVTSSADLTLNTLMHFLDRFVFRNPKKHIAVKGTSIMQPALGGDTQDDVLLRRTGVPLDYVNDARFWALQPEQVPADLQFFHQYFQSRLKRSQAAPNASKEERAPGATEEISNALSDDDLSTEDEDEKEIWQAMKASLPQHDEDDASDDDDDDLLEELENEMEDEEEGDDNASDEPQTWSDHESDDDDDAMFMEDEDDLVPFTDFDAEATQVAGQKRPAEDAPPSKNKDRTAQRQKRRALPEFASAEDYAHMLDSDDEGN